MLKDKHKHKLKNFAAQKLKMDFNAERRKFLKTALYASAGAAVAYKVSDILDLQKLIPYTLPSVNAQSAQVTEIDVGLLQVPVTVDGQIDASEWDTDSNDYESSVTKGQSADFHFRAKYDSNYVYNALLVPGMTYPSYVELYFDTKNTGQFATGTDGLYTLNLKPTTNGWYESPDDLSGYISGTPFSKMFNRGIGYDWAGTFGPSGLQLEFKFNTDILNKYSSKINFNVGVLQSRSPSDAASFSWDGYVPMVFKSQPLPEFPSGELALFASVVGAVGAAKLAKRKMTRREFTGISLPDKANGK